MRRILLSCACIAILVLPAAASPGATGQAGHGFLVVQGAAGDGGVAGRPVVTVVVHGFVLGRISEKAQARVDVFQIASPEPGRGAPAAVGDVSHTPVKWRSFRGTEYSGIGFRFRALGGDYRVEVRGSGVYLFVGGHGSVTLRGSSFDPKADGRYSLDGAPFRSLPKQPLRLRLGGE